MKITLHELIDQGGFAAVYRGEDELSRQVAVKIVREASEAISDALQHARVLARAKHPNVVDVYSIEDVDDPERGATAKGIVMELLSGRTFEVFRNATPQVDAAVARKLGEGLLSGLSHIHSCELAHGDLHMKNVMVCDNGTLKIIDILYRGTLRDLSTTSREERRQRDINGAFILLKDMLKMAGIEGRAMYEFASAFSSEESLEGLRDGFLRAFAPPADSRSAFGTQEETLRPTQVSQSSVVQLSSMRFSNDTSREQDVLALTVVPLTPLDLLLDRRDDVRLRSAIQGAYNIPAESMQLLRRDTDSLHVDYEDLGQAASYLRRWRLLTTGGIRVITRSLHHASTEVWLLHVVTEALSAMRFARSTLEALGCDSPAHVLHQFGVERGALRLGSTEARAVGLPSDSRGEKRGSTVVSAHQQVLRPSELPSTDFLGRALVKHLRSLFGANPDLESLLELIERTD